jgi:hypothetical protein
VIFIRSGFRILPATVPFFMEDEIKNEPMLFNCDSEHAHKLGGPITRSVLDRIPLPWCDVPLVIDSRVHMLMPGWYPCIPGWHHDDVPRTRSDMQPNYGPGQVRSEHIACLVNGDICPTAFATGRMEFPEVELGRTVYGEWHQKVGEAIARGELEKSFVPSNRLVLFDDRTWHAGTPARANGWRYFIRISRYYSPDGNPTERPNPRTNEVRRQVQVYLENANAGW